MDQQPLGGIYWKVHVPHQLLPPRGIITELYRKRGDDLPPVRGHFLLILTLPFALGLVTQNFKSNSEIPVCIHPIRPGAHRCLLHCAHLKKKKTSEREYCLPEELLMGLSFAALGNTHCCVRLR